MGWNVFTAAAGLWVGAWIGAAINDAGVYKLSEAQASYTRCVTDGAPPDNCAKTYLLPEENK